MAFTCVQVWTRAKRWQKKRVNSGTTLMRWSHRMRRRHITELTLSVNLSIPYKMNGSGHTVRGTHPIRHARDASISAKSMYVQNRIDAYEFYVFSWSYDIFENCCWFQERSIEETLGFQSSSIPQEQQKQHIIFKWRRCMRGNNNRGSETQTLYDHECKDYHDAHLEKTMVSSLMSLVYNLLCVIKYI